MKGQTLEEIKGMSDRADPVMEAERQPNDEIESKVSVRTRIIIRMLTLYFFNAPIML